MGRAILIRQGKMKKWMKMCLAVWIAVAPLAAWSAATYTMKVTPSMPKGSAGEKLLATQPTNTKLSPCSAALVDAVSFALAYNAGSAPDIRDVYMFFFNPNGDGVTTPKYYVVSRSSISNGGLALVARFNLADLKPATDLYLAAEANPGAAVTESLLSSFISIDGITVGTWQLIGIVADRASVNFDLPDTWLAWDVATIVVSKPWKGTASTTCK